MVHTVWDAAMRAMWEKDITPVVSLKINQPLCSAGEGLLNDLTKVIWSLREELQVESISWH